MRAADGVSIVRPGDATYQAEALRSSNLVASLASLQVGDRQTSSRSFSLNEASVLAPFARVGGTTCFAHGAATSDGL
ncbi:MAG: hypothetical protein ACKOPS_03895, partial [Cyanobium sp.]